ncbi:MAG TPA: hypothetical protein PKD46_05635, partial [Aggregatilineaceae bacterium]|nr:hypothetical protein [Aggregatilineaceae bacterium]
PLTNIASVTARAVNTGRTVSADAAASVDIADSALRMELVALDPVAEIGDTVRFAMTLYNDGDQPITGLAYAPLGGTLRSFGTLPALGGTLPPGASRALNWTYTIQDGDPDPLINTVRVTGTVSGRTLAAQEQAVVDITNPAIGIVVTVVEPATDTVLRGGEAIYAIEVTNKGAQAICGVQVSQLRVDPDTGQETPIIPSVQMGWPDAGQPGRLEGNGSGDESASASTTYLVTSTDKDPLHMVFRVTALSACEGGGALLTDRTSRVLNISDVQVNAEIGVKVGGVAATSAEVGEFAEFTYLVTNAGTIPLSNVSATYCFLPRTPAEPPNCAVPLPLVNLQGGALLQYETATGIFTTMMTQADADQGQFPVEVTLYATDNRGRDVTLKTTTVIDVTTPDVLLEVTGPAEAVNGDTHSFTFVLTNNTGADLTDVQVFRLTDPANPASGVPVGSLATLSGQIGNNTYTGSFDYTLDAPPGATTLRLTLRATATRGDSGAVATASHDIKLIPLILVEKTGPAVAVPGESVTYHVVITNQSVSQTFTTAPNGLADDVLARYNVPVSADDFTWPGAAGMIPPGESASADFALPDVQADVSPLINTFSVSGTNNAGQAASGVGQHEMEVTCPVIFQFRVTEVPPTDLFDDAIHILNETLRWEITLVNTTQSELTNVSLTESLNWGGPVPAGAITWPTGTPGVIPPNGTATLQPFEKMITNDYYPETIQDVYMTSRLVASFSPVASRSECAGQFDAPLFSPVTVIKEADTSIALTGDTVTYTITMINMAAASDPYNTFTVTLTDPLLSANPIPMYYNGAGQPATMSGVMGPGEIVTGPPLTYVVKDSDPDKLINTATAEFPDPADPETTFYTIGQAEVLTINPLTLVKTPSALNGIRGTTIYYDYELTNNTEYEIEGIRLVDDRIGQLIPGTHAEPPWTTLTLGGFETFTISGVPYYIEVDAADPVVNTATATGTIHLPGGDRDLTAEATVAVDLEEPDIEIEKTARDAAIGVPLPDDLPQHIAGGDGILEGTSGQQIEYCFTVTNNSPSAETYVDSIVIEDVKLGAGALQPWFLAAVEGKYGSRTPLNRLYGGESVEFCYETAITLNRAQGDPQTNTVTLTGVTPSGSATIPVYTDDSLTIDLIGTDILITKSASQPLAYIGQDVTYTIRIENRNDSLPINDIALFDSFLGEVDLAALDWSANNSGGNPGSLGVGGVATLVYSYTIQPRDPDPLINSASVSGTLGDDQNTPVEDATQSSLAITPSQLLVRKFPSVARSLPEKTVRYTIAITNVGQIPVYDLRATDTRYTGDMTPSLTTLMPNKTAYITYDLVMPTVAELSADPTLDPYVNTVTVEGTVYDTQGIPQADPVTGQATAAVDIIQPNVSISKVAQVEAATPGNDVTYTITIRNTGGEGDTLSDVVFTDVTTGDTVDLDSVCPGAGCGFVYGAEPYFDDDGNAETPMVPNPLAGDPYDPAHGLQHGEFLTGEITVTAPPATQGSEFTNVVEIEASLDATTVRDRSSATIDIRQEGIRVTKRADTATATIGQSVQYTVAVENTGTVPFTRVTIADVALPGGTATITGGFPDTAGDAGTLDPGEVYEHVYTHQITPADGDPYTNRASVSAYTAAGAMVRNDAWVTVDVQLAELSVEKFVCAEDNPEGASAPDPCTAVVNVADAQPDTVYYYVHIANPSIVPIENISVDDPLAPPGAFDASAWPGGQNALAANDGAPGGPDEAWFKYTYTVTESDLDVLWNTVTVSGQTPTDPPQTAEDVARAALRLVTGDLQLTKTGPAQAQIGESVTYTLSVTHLNPQGDPITNITIVDPLSASGTQPVCTIATLAPGATDDSCTFSRTVALGDPAPLVNQAFAQGTQASAPGGTVSDTATHTLDIVTPGLSVSKTASVPVARFGDTVTFTYVVQNTGQGEISSLVVTDSDPQIVFSAPWPTRLPAGQTVVRTATRTLTALDPDPYTNTLTVTGRRGGQTVRAQASATVALSDAALAVSNVPDRQYALDGQAVIFAYTARNLGSEPLNNLTFSDNGLCAGLDTQLVSTTLAPRSSVTVYCTVNAALPGPLVSTVRAAADAEGGPVSDTATAQVQVTTGGLLVSKTANRLVATPGDTIRYTITVTNVGDEPLHNLALFESMGIDLVPPLPATLQPGASATLSGEVAVPAANPPDSVANSVSVTAIGANTQTRYQDNASAAVAILEDPNAVLALTKQANTQTGGAEPTLRARPTDSVMYTFTVRNVSSETATGITLSDPALGAPIPLGDLGPGETATLSGSAAIPPDHAQPTFDNTASVSTGGAEPVLQDTASASVPVQLLGLTKTADAAEAEPGGEATYTFTVESFTLATLEGVTLEDEGLTLDTPLPGTIPPEGASASGRMTVPADFLDATFVNIAALRMNGVWLDEASASVEVIPRTLEITLDSITQLYEGGALDLIQTGEEAVIAFTLRNAGTGPIATVEVNASVAIPDSAATAACTRADGSPLPKSLQVGQEIPGVCRYTPPAGLASYLDAGGLTPLVTLTASGDPGGGRVEVTASDTMPLVDLALTVDLAVTPDS